MKGRVSRHMLPHLSGVPHLALNRPLEKFDLLLRVFRLKRRKIPRSPGSNPEPRTRTCRILTFLLCHYTTTRTRQNFKIPKNLNGDTSKLSFLTVTSGHFFPKNLIPGWKLQKQNEANQGLKIRSLVQTVHLYLHLFSKYWLSIHTMILS